MEGFWQILTHHWSAVPAAPPAAPAAPPAAPAPMLAIEDGSIESDPNEVHSSGSEGLLSDNGAGTVAPFDPYYSVSVGELEDSDSETEPSFSDISAEAVGQVEKASGPSETPSPDMSSSSPAPAFGVQQMSTEELLEKRARLRQIRGMVGIVSDALGESQHLCFVGFKAMCLFLSLYLASRFGRQSLAARQAVAAGTAAPETLEPPGQTKNIV